MAKLYKAPLELLITIVSEHASDKVLEILDEFKAKNSLVILANGTVESEIVDLFGFGQIERTITATFIKSENSALIVERISKDLNFHCEEGKGLAFTIPLNSMEKSVLDFYKVKLEEINGKRK